MQAKLVVVGGDIGRAEIPLRLPATIGRSRDATLTLPHPLVSRQHCEIFERDGKLVVRDLDSRNGTYINHQRIDAEHELESGGLLTIGAVTFRAVYGDQIEVEDIEGGDKGASRGAIDVAGRRWQVSDSVVPLSESELFDDEELSDDAFGVDSGHFDTPESESNSK